MMTMLRKLWNDEQGVTAIEYGLIATLVAVALIAGARVLGGALDAQFTAIGGTIQNG